MSSPSQWRRNRGFNQFNEPGPRAPRGPRVRGQKNLRPKSTTPLSALRASSFSPCGPAEGAECPQVTVEPGPLRALLYATAASQVKFVRPHCLHAVHRCGLLLQMPIIGRAWSVSLSLSQSACWSRFTTASRAKRLNRSRQRLG